MAIVKRPPPKPRYITPSDVNKTKKNTTYKF